MTALLELATWISIAVTAVEIAGILTALHALKSVRTSQGTIAWCVTLITFPFAAVPLYWIFGRSKFNGYREVIREALSKHVQWQSQLRKRLSQLSPERLAHDARLQALSQLTAQHFTRGNRVDLLIDGEATFSAIFEAINAAQNYILVQFFIIKDDQIGRELQQRLIQKAEAGVKVYVLYDEVGSHRLSNRYLAQLREAGVQVAPFYTTRGWRNRFQFNFRNHRKIVVVDGRIAFAGGLNVGDEYLGGNRRLTPWRDTHLRIQGPAVQTTQIVFAADWYWAQRELLADLHWEPADAQPDDFDVLTLPTGPVDPVETCALYFVNIINQAKSRLWIASPYFVPDQSIVNALTLAVLRGVDVRILLAGKPDHLIVYLASFAYLQQMDEIGVKVYRYQDGFMHQKALVVDDRLASVGTANLDNRSFRLNFELSVVVADSRFAQQVATMLERDLEKCRQTTADDLANRWFGFRVGSQVARLFSPIL